MKNSSIKISFIPLLITLMFFSFVGSSLANEVPQFQQWSYGTTYGSYTLVKTTTYWEYTINTATVNGAGIGSPFYIYSQTYNDRLDEINVDWQIISVTSNACKYGIFNNTGSNQTSVTPTPTIESGTSKARTTNTYSISSGANGSWGFGVGRNAGTCNAVFRIYEITNGNGDIIWSPETVEGSTIVNIDTTKQDLMLELIALIMLISSLIWVSLSGMNFFLQFRK